MQIVMFAYVFIWPFVVDVVCAWALWSVQPEDFDRTVVALAALVAVSAAPLMFDLLVQHSGSDISAGSLMAYGPAVVVLVLGAGSRALVRVLSEAD